MYRLSSRGWGEERARRKRREQRGGERDRGEEGSNNPSPTPITSRRPRQLLVEPSSPQAMRTFALIAKIQRSHPLVLFCFAAYIYLIENQEKEKDNAGSKAAHCLFSINFYQCGGANRLTVRYVSIATVQLTTFVVWGVLLRQIRVASNVIVMKQVQYTDLFKPFPIFPNGSPALPPSPSVKYRSPSDLKNIIPPL